LAFLCPPQRLSLEYRVARVLAKLGFHETGSIEPDPVHGDSLLTVREF
jgi:hypothetical protein